MEKMIIEFNVQNDEVKRFGAKLRYAFGDLGTTWRDITEQAIAIKELKPLTEKPCTERERKVQEIISDATDVHSGRDVGLWKTFMSEYGVWFNMIRDMAEADDQKRRETPVNVILSDYSLDKLNDIVRQRQKEAVLKIKAYSLQKWYWQETGEEYDFTNAVNNELIFGVTGDFKAVVRKLNLPNYGKYIDKILNAFDGTHRYLIQKHDDE